MMCNCYRRLKRLAPLLLCLASSWPGHALGQSTEFSYQGKLNDGAKPANGIYDLSFALYDSATPPGNGLAESVLRADIPVSNGLFSVTLDFGGEVFTGPGRWLEVSVRTNGGDIFTTLLPRQPITPVPYAVLANAANTLLGPLSGTNLTAGSIPDSALAETYYLSSNPSGFAPSNAVGLLAAQALAEAGAVTNYATQPLVFDAVTISNLTGNIAAATNATGNLPLFADSPLNGTNIMPGTLPSTVFEQSYQAENAALAALATNNGAALTQINLLNVKSYGATGDGVTDDSDAIQTAVNVLQNGYYGQAPTEPTLFFPPGTYRLSKPIGFLGTPGHGDFFVAKSDGIVLRGAGKGLTVLQWPPGFRAIGLGFTNHPQGGLTLRDMTISGPGEVSGDNTSVGLVFGGPLGEDSLFTLGGRNVTILGCQITGWGTGLSVTNFNHFQVLQCNVHSNVYEGLRFAGTHCVAVRDTQVGGGFHDRWATGIGIGFHLPGNAGLGDNAEVVNCAVSACTNGIYNEELNLNILNCNIEFNGYHIQLNQAAGCVVVGSYTLDGPGLPWAKGLPAQISLTTDVAHRCSFINFAVDTAARPIFNVIGSGAGLQLPNVVGPAWSGLWQGKTPVTAGINGTLAMTGVLTNTTGTKVRGQLPISVNGVTYYLDLKH